MAEFIGISKKLIFVESFTVLIKVQDCAMTTRATFQVIFDVLGVVTMNTDGRLGETSMSLGVHF